MKRLLHALALSMVLAFPLAAPACPNCQSVMTEATEADGYDPMREARAYNTCIMVMVVLPYLLLGVISYKVYTGVKAQELRRQRQADELERQEPQS